MHRTRRHATALVLAALLGLVGCGGDDDLDTEGVEQDIEEGVDDAEQELDDAGDDG